MPITRQQLPNEPIVVISLHGEVTMKELQGLFAESATLFDEDINLIYCIIDISSVDVSIAGAISLLSDDPRFVPCFVSATQPDQVPTMLRQNSRRGNKIPVYDNLGKAIQAASQMRHAG